MIGNDGQKHHPIMIHRALLGSIERFFGILIEHFEGKFPLWLAPNQVSILSIGDSQGDYGEFLYDKLKKEGFRVELDLRNEKIGSKIRDHTLKKVPYLIIVGDKEVESNNLSVRSQNGKDLGQMSLDVFLEILRKELII